MTQPTLNVTFADETTIVGPGERLSFGRKADIEIDSNRYLHRVVGTFEWVNDGWWLANTGSAIILELSDAASSSRISIAPGASVHLSFTEATLRFQAGRSPYEITVEQAVTPPETDQFDDLTGDTTVTAATTDLNEEQRLLLVGLAQKQLRDPAAPKSALVTNKAVADSLGWTKTKFDRKLDNLCVKFANLGVPGLVAGTGQTASRRRETLITSVITQQLITFDDLIDYERAVAEHAARIDQGSDDEGDQR